MKKTGKVTTRALLFGLILLLGVLTTMQVLANDQSKDDREPLGKQWQHLALTQVTGKTSMSELARRINQVGREGWELVSVEGLTESGTTTSTVFYFKKPLF